MRNKLFILILFVVTLSVSAQNGSEAYTFLRFPTSTRANALGGHTVALVERDPSLIFHNPALLGAEMDGMINLNYMNYISDINVGSALFTKAQRGKGLGRRRYVYKLWRYQEVLPDNVVTWSESFGERYQREWFLLPRLERALAGWIVVEVLVFGAG